ncbi:MAG: tetratricopeptide repeat protein [Acidobacteriota bacterium]
MLKKFISLLVFYLVLSCLVFAQEIAPPKLEPKPTTEKHDALIRDGIALHDKGNFDGAIAKYQEVLTENSEDVLALYELGYSYFAKSDYKKSLEIAYKGTQYKSKYLVGFYVLIGNNLDNLNESEKAIKVYQSGLKLYPDNQLLHFNLAVTLLRLNKTDEGKKSLKNAMMADPNYRSSHYLLAQLYHKENYKIPAILAICRFLVVEPDSPRSASALQGLLSLLSEGATKGKDNQINIVINTDSKNDEGDFGALQGALAIMSAAKHLDESKKKSEVQLWVESLTLLLSLMDEAKDGKKQPGFAWNYYRPYFIEIRKRNFTEPFAYFILQSKQSPEVQKWLVQNYQKVNEFLAWSKSYQWYNGK